MDFVLRKLAEWKGRSRAAQVIVFDGGAEVERTRSFLRGALAGIGLTSAVFLLAAPGGDDARLVEEVARQQTLLRQNQQQLDQAMQVAAVCLASAERLEGTVRSYENVLGGRVGN